MTTIQFGSIVLGKIPRIIAILDSPIDLQKVQNYKTQGADIFEIRGDCFTTSPQELADYVAKVKSEVGLPLLGTIKENDRTVGKRVDMYKLIIDNIDGLDTDIDAPDRNDLLQLAGDKVKIISYHEFDKTPEKSEMAEIVDRAVDLGADIVKVATMINSREDAIRLLNFTAEREEPMVTIGMGPIGTITRIAAPLFGSLFTFAFVGEAVAPGQLSLPEMILHLRTLYPDYEAKFS